MTDKQARGMLVATRLRNYFLTGLIICAPIAITVWMTWTFIQWADSWVQALSAVRLQSGQFPALSRSRLRPADRVDADHAGRFLRRQPDRPQHRRLRRIARSVRTPLVRTIYKGLKQIFQTVLQEQSNSFKKAGLIEYPSPGLWSLVFIATDAKGEIAVEVQRAGPRYGRRYSCRRRPCRRPAS